MSVPLASTADDRRCEVCNEPIWWKHSHAIYCDKQRCKKEGQRRKKQERRNGSPLGNGTVLRLEDGYFEALDAVRGDLEDWKPHRKTKVMLGQVHAIFDEYREHLPLTCRQIYYRMVAEYGHPKGDKLENTIYDLLSNARRARNHEQFIPFDYIRDDGIQGGGGWYSSVHQFRQAQYLQAKNYTRDVQVGQESRLQVWCEAAGIIPQLAKICDPYSIPVYSCGGFNSLTAVRQIVDSCVWDHGGPTILLHLGDADPSGYSIFQAVYEDVAAFLERDRRFAGQTFTAEKVALKLDQIEKHGLTKDEITTNDPRSKVWRERGFTHKCEIEALPPNEVARLLTEAIERHVDEDAREEALKLEIGERAAVYIPEPKPLIRCDHTRLLERLRQSNNGGGW
jgi:hypothetical protein